MHPDRADRVRGVDADQAGPGQVGDGAPGQVLIRARGAARPAGDEAARRRAGQHGPGDPVRVEHGGQGQGRPGQPGGHELVRALGGQRPGGQDRRGDALDRPGRHVRAPFAELRAVLLAAQPVRVHHRDRVGQADRQAVEVLGEIESLDPLVGVVGEPGTEVGQGLPAAEPAHRGDPQAAGRRVRAGAEGRAGQPGRDDDLAVRSGRPQSVQVGHVGQVVEDQGPPPLGPGEPGGEAARVGRRAGVRVARADRAGRLREPGDDRLPAGGADPDQHVGGAGVPQGVSELHGELRLAGASLSRQGRLGLLAVGQHHRLAGEQARLQVDPGLQALEVAVGERRDVARHQHLRVRRRPGTLRDHVDSLSRNTVLTPPGAGGRYPPVMAARPPHPALIVSARSRRATILHLPRSPVPKGMLVAIPASGYALRKV